MANGDAPMIAGEDYLSDENQFSRRYQIQMDMEAKEMERLKEEEAKKNPLSAQNVGMFNTVLATVNAMQNVKNNRLAYEINMAGGFENKDTPGGWEYNDDKKKWGKGRGIQLAKRAVGRDIIRALPKAVTLDELIPGNTDNVDESKKTTLNEIFKSDKSKPKPKIKEEVVKNPKKNVDAITVVDTLKDNLAIDKQAKKMKNNSSIFTSEAVSPMGLSHNQTSWMIKNKVPTNDMGEWLITNKEAFAKWGKVK